MNNNGTGTQTPPSGGSDTGQASDATGQWVSKTSRHRQLINSAVYERENQNRAKAIEVTRKQQLANQNAQETAQLSTLFQRQPGVATATASANPSSVGHHELDISGIRFRVTQNGSKLVKVSGGPPHIRMTSSRNNNTQPLPGDLHAPNATPKIATVGGVKFHRSRNGNLYRDGLLKAQRQSGIKKVDEPCRMFSSTGI